MSLILFCLFYLLPCDKILELLQNFFRSSHILCRSIDTKITAVVYIFCGTSSCALKIILGLPKTKANRIWFSCLIASSTGSNGIGVPEIWVPHRFVKLYNATDVRNGFLGLFSRTNNIFPWSFHMYKYKKVKCSPATKKQIHYFVEEKITFLKIGFSDL